MYKQKEQGYIYISIISALMLVMVFIAQDPTRVSTDIPDISKNDQQPITTGLAIVDQPVVQATGTDISSGQQNITGNQSSGNMLSGSQHAVSDQTGAIQTGVVQTGIIQTGNQQTGTLTGLNQTWSMQTGSTLSGSLSGTLTGNNATGNNLTGQMLSGSITDSTISGEIQTGIIYWDVLSGVQTGEIVSLSSGEELYIRTGVYQKYINVAGLAMIIPVELFFHAGPGVLYKIDLSCRTPRGQKLNHGEFVYAYAFRDDVNHICDVQKRVCYNGVLQWTYDLFSCEQHEPYEYTLEEVKAYNVPVRNPFIQPDDRAGKYTGEFGLNGKIQEYLQPKNTWFDTPSDASGWDQKFPEGNMTINCISPRGELVKDTQFVKAYDRRRWYIDKPCGVELRTCIDGKLQGSYTQQTCTSVDAPFDIYFLKDISTNNAAVRQYIINRYGKNVVLPDMRTFTGGVYEYIQTLDLPITQDDVTRFMMQYTGAAQPTILDFLEFVN